MKRIRLSRRGNRSDRSLRSASVMRNRTSITRGVHHRSAGCRRGGFATDASVLLALLGVLRDYVPPWILIPVAVIVAFLGLLARPHCCCKIPPT